MDATARNDKVPFYLESLSKEGLLQSAAAEFNRLKVDNGNAPRGKEFSNPPELESTSLRIVATAWDEKAQAVGLLVN